VLEGLLCSRRRTLCTTEFTYLLLEGEGGEAFCMFVGEEEEGGQRHLCRFAAC